MGIACLDEGGLSVDSPEERGYLVLIFACGAHYICHVTSVVVHAAITIIVFLIILRVFFNVACLLCSFLLHCSGFGHVCLV